MRRPGQLPLDDRLDLFAYAPNAPPQRVIEQRSRPIPPVTRKRMIERVVGAWLATAVAVERLDVVEQSLRPKPPQLPQPPKECAAGQATLADPPLPVAGNPIRHGEVCDRHVSCLS